MGKIVLLGSIYYLLLSSHLCKSAVSTKICDHKIPKDFALTFNT